MTRAVLLLCALLAPLSLFVTTARAETRYVTDQVLVELRAQPDARSAVVDTLPTGTPLEVQQTRGNYARVTAPGGREGWVATAMLSANPPALATLLRLQDEQRHTRAELDRLRAERAFGSVWVVAAIGLLAFLVGFVAGVLWLDHRIRVRHGGFRI